MSERDIIADARHALAAWNQHQKDPDFDGPHEHHLAGLVKRFIRELEAERVDHIVQRDLARFAVRVLDQYLADWAECIGQPDLGTDPDALRDLTLGLADEVERLKGWDWNRLTRELHAAPVPSLRTRPDSRYRRGLLRSRVPLNAPALLPAPVPGPGTSDVLWPCDTLDTLEGGDDR